MGGWEENGEKLETIDLLLRNMLEIDLNHTKTGYLAKNLYNISLKTRPKSDSIKT